VRRTIVLTILALLTSAGMVALGLMSFHSGTAQTRPLVLPFEIFWCANDDDCTVVDRIGCCPCSQGGAQTAITSWRQADLRRFLRRACVPDQPCIQVDLCRADLRARCRDRRCVLEPDADAARANDAAPAASAPTAEAGARPPGT
jgi:hypothetical protein